MSCPYCHEDSSKEGLHGNILNSEFAKTLKPYTELAIGGGNPLSHPDLIDFLFELKDRKIIANITVNITHFLEEYPLISVLAEKNLIKGLGVSINPWSAINLQLNKLKEFPNLVLHVINGVIDMKTLERLYNQNLKLLILGYKEFRRGNYFYSEQVEERKSELKSNIVDLLTKFKVVSFDNLALNQLDIKSILPTNVWDEFYMGDDGQHTMYIDMVRGMYARNSTSTVRYALENDIVTMFNKIKE
jgi:hypothetical protein